MRKGIRMAKELKSIFTDNLNKCLVTSAMTGIERHHVFGGADRQKSEKYGFICPLHASVHPNGAYRTDKNWMELDHWLKRMSQEWYIEVAQIGDRGDWLREFGRFYDDRCDEKVWLNGRWTWDLRKEKP